MLKDFKLNLINRIRLINLKLQVLHLKTLLKILLIHYLICILKKLKLILRKYLIQIKEKYFKNYVFEIIRYEICKLTKRRYCKKFSFYSKKKI